MAGTRLKVHDHKGHRIHAFLPMWVEYSIDLNWDGVAEDEYPEVIWYEDPMFGVGEVEGVEGEWQCIDCGVRL